MLSQRCPRTLAVAGERGPVLFVDDSELGAAGMQHPLPQTTACRWLAERPQSRFKGFKGWARVAGAGEERADLGQQLGRDAAGRSWEREWWERGQLSGRAGAK